PVVCTHMLSLSSTPCRLSFYVSRPRPDLHSFPTRRSSDLYSTCSISNSPSLFSFLFSQAGGREREKKRENRRATERRRVRVLVRSEEHTSELQSRFDLVCRLLLEKKNTKMPT